MTRFKSVPVHVSSPVRQTGQARQSAQVKRRGSVLDGPGSKRTRVIRTSVAVDQEESLEEEQWQSPAASEEDWSGSDSEEATSEETRQDGRAENMETPEQTVESIEQEAEFRRDSMSGGRSPELSQAGRAQSSRAPRRSGVEVSPGSVRRRRVKKHVHIAVRKAPATKDNQKGALRAFRKFWRSEPYNREGEQEVNEENVRTFFEEIDEERSPTIDKYVKGLQLTMREMWAAGGKLGAEPNIRMYEEVKVRRAQAKKATAALRRRPGYDKQRDMPDRISRQDIRQIVQVMTEYLCLSNEELKKHGMTRSTLINMRADILEWFITMTRSKTTREGELSDLSVHFERDIGPSLGWTLDIINDLGKTNANGNMEVTAVLQNKDPVMCAWGSRALALMYNLAKKERPKALETDWYTWKKSPGRKGNKAGYSYQTQRRYIRHFVREAGLDSRKATHIGRRHGARDAVNSAPREDVETYARFSKSRSDHFSRSYAQDSPMTVQFVMAGFQEEAKERNFADGYRLARLAVAIPKDLLKRFCPWIDKDLKAIQGHNEKASLDGDKLVTSEKVFEFLSCSKEVFLSNLASLERQYPDLCVFQEMNVFQRPEWTEYKREVQSAEAHPERCLPPRQDKQSLLMTALQRQDDKLDGLAEALVNLATRRGGFCCGGARSSASPRATAATPPTTPPSARRTAPGANDPRAAPEGAGHFCPSPPLRPTPRPMDERQAPPDFRPELSGGRFEHRRGPRFEGGRFQPGSGRGQSGVGQGFVPGRNEATGARSTGARGGAGGATRPEVGAAARGRGSTEAARGRNHGFGSGNEERERTAGRQGTTGTATGAPERTHGPRETGGEAESDAESDEVYEDGEPIPGQPYIYPWPTCKDVRDVYREMYIGFTGYMPALVELENAHGSAWRRGKGQRQRFNEKVQICKYVERIQAEHGFENAITAVEFLAGKYRSLKSLLKDMRALKKAEKQGD